MPYCGESRFLLYSCTLRVFPANPEKGVSRMNTKPFPAFAAVFFLTLFCAAPAAAFSDGWVMTLNANVGGSYTLPSISRSDLDTLCATGMNGMVGFVAGGDLEVGGEITGYDVRATAVTADEVAAQNRLTITVKMYYINNKHPEENFEAKSFTAYEDYDSTQSLDAVQSSLCQTIVETIVEDIFNATVANW